MSDVLVIAENHGESIHPVAFELLGKGKELADKLDSKLKAALLDDGSGDPEKLIHRGADLVYVEKDEMFAGPDEIIHREGLVKIIDRAEPEIILIGATNFGRSLAPRLAMYYDTGLTADCTGLEVDQEKQFVQIRPAFSGNILAHIKNEKRPQMSTVRYKEMEAPEPDEERDGEIIELEPPEGPLNSGIEIVDKYTGETVELAEAEVVVAGGRGLKDPEDFGLLEDLAELLGGVVGASRPLVDEGWIGREHQVGYSGRRVQPEIYFACGISGQSQHLAGMKDSEMIIAVNKDPSAPIFEYSDYGIVGDLYEVIPEIVNKLKGDEKC